jgi:hypothetical protein
MFENTTLLNRLHQMQHRLEGSSEEFLEALLRRPSLSLIKGSGGLRQDRLGTS